MCLQLTPQYASFAAWHSHVHGQAGNIAWYWGRGGFNTTFAAKENAPGDFADQALTQPAAIDGYLLHFRTVLFFLKHFLFCFSSVSQ